MRKNLIYKNLPALEPVKKILKEANEALQDTGRTIASSSMPEVLGAIAGGTAGVGAGLVMVYAAGSVVGFSAAGITSGLAALGAILGGGMAAGIAVAAAPAAALGATGYALVVRRKSDQTRPGQRSPPAGSGQEARRSHPRTE